LPQAGEKVIQTVGLLAGFCHDAFISGQQVGVLTIQKVPTKERPQYLRPGDDRVKETLHRSVAATFFGPSRYPQHGYSACHGDHRNDDPAQLLQGRFGNAVLYRL